MCPSMNFSAASRAFPLHLYSFRRSACRRTQATANSRYFRVGRPFEEEVEHLVGVFAPGPFRSRHDAPLARQSFQVVPRVTFLHIRPYPLSLLLTPEDHQHNPVALLRG